MENLTPGCASHRASYSNPIKRSFLGMLSGLFLFLAGPLLMALDISPHWEYIDNAERYGYWVPGVQSGYWDYSSGAGHYETTEGYWEGSNGRYEVTGSHMEMRGHWDYSAGFGHEEFRYTNSRWEYDEYGNANFVEDTEVVWVEDPIWIEESVSVDDYTYVEDMVWVPGSEVWVDDPVYVDQSTPDSWVDLKPPEEPQPPDSPGDGGCGCECDEVGAANFLQNAVPIYDQSLSAYAVSDPQAVSSLELELWRLVAAGDFTTVTTLVGASQYAGTPLGQTMIAQSNKINHIFNNPGHNMTLFLQKIGLGAQETVAALNMIQTAANSNAARLAAAANSCGIFEQPVVVQGVTIVIRGNVINGTVNIGTAFVR